MEKVGFVNKGAELMLHAIMQTVSANISDVKFVMKPIKNKSTYCQRGKLGIYQKLEFSRLGICNPVFKLIPKDFRDNYGMVVDSELDAVINAAGFSYGDQWGPNSTTTTARKMKKWTHNGTKVILLPQAFGPFSTPKIRKGIREMVNNADLIYARDPKSYANLIEVAGSMPNIKMSPDFTNLVVGAVPDYFSHELGDLCIVPNSKMIDKTKEETSTAYLPFLIKSISILKEKGFRPFFLIHEGMGDLHIAEEANRQFSDNLNIIMEPDPIMIKGIIGECKGMIGSRFHGLVSALVQNVPSIGTGWSHKYQMLFESYNISEGLVAPSISHEELEIIIDSFFMEPNNQKIVKEIAAQSTRQKNEVLSMWNEVMDILKS